MFGKIFSIDLKFDSHELLYIINDFLKSNGISHFNNIEGNKLRGNGDAGMGVFEIEKRRDRDKILRLHVETNSSTSADILKNLIEIVLEHMEENELYEVLEEEEEIIEKPEAEKKEVCNHDFHLLKEDELFGIKVEVYHCDKCNKLEFYKK